MKTKGNLIVASIFCVIISSVGQWYLLVEGIGNINFWVFQIIFFIIDGMLILATLYVAGFILLKKGFIEQQKIKLMSIIVTAILVLTGMGLSGYGYFICYNVYTPESQLENPGAIVRELFPYHDISDGDDLYLEVSHNLVADYIGFYCNGTSKSGDVMVYRVDYFESLSPLMNAYYTSGKTLETPFSDPFAIDVDAPGESMSIDGKEVTLYVDNGDYAVLISDFNNTIYASLTGSTESVTEKEFAKEVVKQFKLIEDVADSRQFLDADE